MIPIKDKYQTSWFYFHSNPPPSLIHLPILLCHAWLEGLFWDVSQLCRPGLLDILYIFLTRTIDDPFELEEKLYEARSSELWGCSSAMFVLVWNCRSCGIINWCIVMVKQPWFVLPLLSSFLAPWAKYTPQDFFIDLLIDRLTPWPEPAVGDASHIGKCDRYDLEFCFPRARLCWTLPLTSPALVFRVIMRIPCLITRDDSMKCLVQF